MIIWLEKTTQTHRCIKLWNDSDASQLGVLYNFPDIILGIHMVCIISTLVCRNKKPSVTVVVSLQKVSWQPLLTSRILQGNAHAHTKQSVVDKTPISKEFCWSVGIANAQVLWKLLVVDNNTPTKIWWLYLCWQVGKCDALIRKWLRIYNVPVKYVELVVCHSILHRIAYNLARPVQGHYSQVLPNDSTMHTL